MKDGCLLGIGTGSTVNLFIKSLAKSGKTLGAIITTSKQSEDLLHAEGLDTIPLSEVGGPLHLYVDGADEVDPRLNLIKGGGGALTSEKIVSNCAEKFVCIVDDSKLVAKLGKFALPIEVISSGLPYIQTYIYEKYGAISKKRNAFISEHGNPILDVSGLEIDHPESLEWELNQVPGVVTVGIFGKLKPSVCLVGCENGVKKIFKKDVII